MSTFRQCTMCRLTWNNRDDFLSDPRLALIGYQARFEELEAGFFLFTHDTHDCGTTLAISVGLFTDMHEGPIFTEPYDDIENCPGYCYNQDSLNRCQAKCECRYVLDVMQQLQSWPKRAA